MASIRSRTCCYTEIFDLIVPLLVSLLLLPPVSVLYLELHDLPLEAFLHRIFNTLNVFLCRPNAVPAKNENGSWGL